MIGCTSFSCNPVVIEVRIVRHIFQKEFCWISKLSWKHRNSGSEGRSGTKILGISALFDTLQVLSWKRLERPKPDQLWTYLEDFLLKLTIDSWKQAPYTFFCLQARATSHRSRQGQKAKQISCIELTRPRIRLSCKGFLALAQLAGWLRGRSWRGPRPF